MTVFLCYEVVNWEGREVLKAVDSIEKALAWEEACNTAKHPCNVYFEFEGVEVE